MPHKVAIQQPRLIIVSAPSGAGKTTLCDLLRKDFPNIIQSISSTTRTQRPHEMNGKHYFFISREEFEQKRAKGDFLEWAKVHGNFYGTSKSRVEELLSAGKHVLFAIDVKGALNIKNLYPKRALLIFIHPPSLEVLEARLTQRKGDSEEAIKERLNNAKKELSQSNQFDFQITNDQLGDAYAELKEIILRECSHV